MSRRSLCLTVGALACVAALAAGVLLLLIRHEPRTYRDAPLPAGDRKRDSSRAFVTKATDLYNQISTDPVWSSEFTDEQVNSYLEEDFITQNLDSQMLPDGISAPRVVFEPDRVHLAFRYGSGAWSSVISVDLHVWLPRCEANVVALELEGFHAGALPITAQSLLAKLSEVGSKYGAEVSWYRHDGHPVALLRFQPEGPRTTLQLTGVHFQEGKVVIQGKTGEPVPARTARVPAAPGEAEAE
jgi:hypothetical protein